MKQLTQILLLLLVIQVKGQTNDQSARWKEKILNETELQSPEYKESLSGLDFGPLWTQTENSSVLGFIGDHFQRIHIKILSVRKDLKDPFTYQVTGKSMVKGNICSFKGTIRIHSIRLLKNITPDVDSMYANAGIKKEGILFADYHFREDNTSSHSGTFEGLLTTRWYINKDGKLKYDDLDNQSDRYCNNQFVGTWKDYRTGSEMICNWGDSRIPFSGDLDMGAAEFSPDNKYLQNGWQSYRDAYLSNDKAALKMEERAWWK